MTRVAAGVARHRRHRKIISQTKGYRGARRNRFKTAKEALIHARAYAYRDRRARKRDFRALWTARLNAACREAGISYSQFIHLLKEQNIQLNRKMLAEIAVRHPEAFKSILASVKG